MKQADYKTIFSEDFLKKKFLEKRILLNDFTLDNHEIKIGTEALCFEDKKANDEGRGSKWFLSDIDTTQKLKSITSNKFYKILDVKNDRDLLIKIEGDSGRKTWVQANRFLIAESVLRRLRKEKLKRLEETFKK